MRTGVFTAALLALALLVLLLPQGVIAQEIYAGKGIFGEASFSDQQLAGHRSVTLDVVPADPNAADPSKVAARLEALAEELAQARLAREEARRPVSSPREVETIVVERDYPDRVGTYFPPRYYPQRNRPSIKPAPPLPPRKTFEPAFRPLRR